MEDGLDADGKGGPRSEAGKTVRWADKAAAIRGGHPPFVFFCYIGAHSERI